MTVCVPKTKEDMFRCKKQACLLRACWYSILRSFEGLEAYTRLPALVGTDLFRVTQANKLYELAAKVILLADSICSSFVGEPFQLALLERSVRHRRLVTRVRLQCSVHFAHCLHGGKRDKNTRWWSNRPWFAALQAACSKDHPHSSWAPRLVNGKPSFPTAEEAAYSHLFGVLRHQLGPSWSWCQQLNDLDFHPLPDSDISAMCGMCSPSNFVKTAEILVIGVPRSPELSSRRRWPLVTLRISL